jgi:hypothetical protein
VVTKRVVYFEDEAHESLSFWTFVAQLLTAVRRIIAGAFGGELFTSSTTTAPLSVLDVLRAGRRPLVFITRDALMLVGDSCYADGLEISLFWRGTRRTLRVGQLGPLEPTKAAVRPRARVAA